MKDSKLYNLTSSLNSVQINFIEKELKSNKRKTLHQLFILLISDKSDFDKSVVYYKIFKTKHSNTNDYLLRNEMRLLLDKITRILLIKQFDDDLEKDSLFEKMQTLKLYKSLDNFELYVDAWKQAKEIAMQEYAYQKLIELNKDYYEFIQFHVRNYKDRLTILEALIEENSYYLNFFSAQEISFNTFLKGNINKLKVEYQLPIIENTNQSKIEIRLNDFDSTLQAYYRLVSKWFPEQGKSKTIILLDALAVLDKCNTQSEIYKKEKIRILYLIATDYSMCAEFEKADFYFEKLFSETDQYLFHNKAYYLYNYAINLTKLNEYNKAFDSIKIAEKFLKPSLDFLNDKYHLLKIICSIFLNDADNLKKLLPNDFSTLLPEQRVYFRFVNAIYHIIEMEYEFAYEEINNLLRSKLINETDIHFLPIAKFFKITLEELAKHQTIKLPKTSLAIIIAAQQKIESSESPIIINYMPYKWLKQHIGV
jgi:hypothetical protein